MPYVDEVDRELKLVPPLPGDRASCVSAWVLSMPSDSEIQLDVPSDSQCVDAETLSGISFS